MYGKADWGTGEETQDSIIQDISETGWRNNWDVPKNNWQCERLTEETTVTEADLIEKVIIKSRNSEHRIA